MLFHRTIRLLLSFHCIFFEDLTLFLLAHFNVLRERADGEGEPGQSMSWPLDVWFPGKTRPLIQKDSTALGSKENETRLSSN